MDLQHGKPPSLMHEQNLIGGGPDLERKIASSTDPSRSHQVKKISKVGSTRSIHLTGTMEQIMFDQLARNAVKELLRSVTGTFVCRSTAERQP